MEIMGVGDHVELDCEVEELDKLDDVVEGMYTTVGVVGDGDSTVTGVVIKDGEGEDGVCIEKSVLPLQSLWVKQECNRMYDSSTEVRKGPWKGSGLGCIQSRHKKLE